MAINGIHLHLETSCRTDYLNAYGCYKMERQFQADLPK